ncbi:hypothetical protein GGF31_001213 [Allomyces arbusculus]|nr:hypothetical protein GGF31_001213 [Allomyces arbusculus]
MSFISSPCYHYHNVAAFHVAPGVTYGLNRSTKRSLQTRDPSPAPTPNSQHARKKFASLSLRSRPSFGGSNSAPVPLSSTMAAIAPVETTPLHAHLSLMHHHSTPIATAAEAAATAPDLNGMDVDVPGSVMA